MISTLICEDNSRRDKNDKFDYGLYGDILFKTYGLFMITDIERFLTFSDPLYSMLQTTRHKASDYPKKVIAYSLFIDFLLKFDYNSVLYKFAEVNRLSTQRNVLQVDRVLEMIIQDSVKEPNIYLRCLLIRGIVKILLHSPELFKGLEINRLEVVALMILQWHNQNLRHSSLFSLSTLQKLSYFFVSQASRSAKSLQNVGNSFLLLVEAFFMIVKSNECFSPAMVKLSFNTQGFMESLFKTFISLSSSSQNINISRLAFLT